MTVKIGMVSLGCPKNQIETEHMLSDILEDENFEIVNDAGTADVIVINTCAFIETAKQEAIDTIFEFAKHKKHNLKSIVVTGCLAERYKTEILKEIPEIDAVLGIGSFKKIKQAIISSLEGKKFEEFDSIENLSLEGKRILSTPPHFAYLKIAEGCSNNCTYCAIPKIRGPYKSRNMENILKEAKWLKSRKIKELIIIAQDTSYYGFDIYGEFKLANLLKEISEIGFEWVRFLYLYPEKISKNLLDIVNKNKNILPYFDLPIQHIDDEILKNMNRKTTSNEIKEKIKLIRNSVENPTIRTTLIAGFPGETEEKFLKLLNFVKEAKFDRLGCFAYSKEEGTAAASFKNQIDEKTKNERVRKLFKESEKIIYALARQDISKTIDTIVDKFENGTYIGRTKKDAPNIDCNVFFDSEKQLSIGDIVKVKIHKANHGDIFGTATFEFVNTN